MQTEEIIPITADSVLDLLRERHGFIPEPADGERRQRPRWPFPGTVELWIPDDDGGETYVLARALNLSTMGIGILSDEEELRVGCKVNIAVHQPEATLFGMAVVRHATQTPDGQVVGLQFLY